MALVELPMSAVVVGTNAVTVLFRGGTGARWWLRIAGRGGPIAYGEGGVPNSSTRLIGNFLVCRSKSWRVACYCTAAGGLAAAGGGVEAAAAERQPVVGTYRR